MNQSAITLTPLTVESADSMFRGLADPALYLYTEDSPPETIEALRATYARRVQGRSPDGEQIWLNWLIRCSGEGCYMGYVQATIGNGSCRAQIAYVVFRRFWRQGVGQRAVRLMIDELLITHGVRTYSAIVDRRNSASRCLLYSMGFRPSKIEAVKDPDILYVASTDDLFEANNGA